MKGKADDFELNEGQLETAAGGIYIIPIFDKIITNGGEDDGCTGPIRP